jgi:glycosyltransferase involved in cell wall biosynthesis
MKYDVSLILACYNEQEIFNDSVDRIIHVLNQTDYTWEIIFVDDKSKDNTKELIKKILKKYPRHNLSAYFHETNQGRGQTVIDGFKQSQGRIVGFIDIDLEVGEWYLPKFISAIESGSDVVTAWRIYDFNLRSLIRWFGSKGYFWLQEKLLRLPLHDTEAGYKFFNKTKIMPILKKCQHQDWFFDTEVLARAFEAKLSIQEIPVAFVRRTDKTSTVRMLPDTIKYLTNLLKFSVRYHHD